MNETPVSADAPADDPYLVLTPAGALHAYGERVPDETSAILKPLIYLRLKRKSQQLKL